MRSKTGIGAWATAVLSAAVALVVPMAMETGAGAATTTTPLQAAASAYPCKTSPAPTASPQNTPPSAPGTPEVVRVTLNSVTLRWAPATDEDGIACYYVREGTTNVATFQPAVTEGNFSLPWPPYGVPYQDHELHVVAVDTKGAVGPASETVTVRIYNDVPVPPSPSVTPQGACRVTYQSFSWGTGMMANISITNTGTQPINDWRLTFSFPDNGQKVTSGWVATWSQSGAQVTAAAPAWGKDLAAGATVNIGFNGTHEGINPDPARFSLNGAVCS
nr:cellulose binding domain-containing protein [Microbispora rosea]